MKTRRQKNKPDQGNRGGNAMEVDPILPRDRAQAMKAGGFWPGRLLLDSLDEIVRTDPDRTAIVERKGAGDRTVLTYRELADRAGRIAVALARLGIEHGDVVSYQLPNWWQFPRSISPASASAP
jgi:cyclohexanecarboxylate-CoA ligase